MSQFVKCRLEGELGNGIYGDASLPREALDVTAEFVKLDTRDVELLKCCVEVEIGDRLNVWFIAHSLRQNKPEWAVHKHRSYLLLIFLFNGVGDPHLPLSGNRHAQSNGAFAPLDLPTESLPSFISVQGAWSQLAAVALQQS
jgi:hypothetical protein